MRYRLEIVSPWVGTYETRDLRPQFHDDYTFVVWMELSVRDDTSYFASPNIGTLVCEVDEAILPVLEADSDYLILSVEEVFDVPL